MNVSQKIVQKNPADSQIGETLNAATRQHCVLLSVKGNPVIHPKDETNRSQTWLVRAAITWFMVVIVGQVAFAFFTGEYYISRTVGGDLLSWNDKELIDGYIANDTPGNMMFLAHVLLASLVTLGGLIQMIPYIRRRVPKLHRYNGRMFIVVSCFLAIGGLWLVWVRGTQLSLIAGMATSINGLLILLFAGLAWRYALRGQIAQHRRFAMRTFMVVSGVWFLRVGLMGWIVINQGPLGMNRTMSGPADIFLTYGSYLVPLAILELYFWAQKTKRPAPAWIAFTAVSMGVIVTAIGVFATIAFMFLPYL